MKKTATERLERRYFPASELRLADAEGVEGGKIIEGYASVYNVEANLGDFVEVFAPNCFAKTVKENQSICSLWNHNDDYPLGKVSAGTLALEEDETGLRYRCSLPNTTYANDLRESIGRGDVSQSSIGFMVIREKWDVRGKVPKRNILEAALRDASPVTIPAYENTSVALRSLPEDSRNELKGFLEEKENIQVENKSLTEGAEAPGKDSHPPKPQLADLEFYKRKQKLMEVS